MCFWCIPNSYWFAHTLTHTDNALITVSQYILLDSMLVMTILMCTYSWIRFCKTRPSPFTYEWYKWLVATGFSLGLVIGIKMVGIFVVTAIGFCVLVELWELKFDIKKSVGWVF
jgi:dolichyl-phosphate-mannose-protein mannosyltransferase